MNPICKEVTESELHKLSKSFQDLRVDPCATSNLKPAHAFHSTGDTPLTSQRIGALGVAHHIVSGVMSRCGCTSLSLFPSDTILRDTIPCFVAHLSFGRERPRVLSRNALAASPGSMSMNQVLAITKTNRLLSVVATSKHAN